MAFRITLRQVARAVEVPVLGRLLCAYLDDVLPIWQTIPLVGKLNKQECLPMHTFPGFR